MDVAIQVVGGMARSTFVVTAWDSDPLGIMTQAFLLPDNLNQCQCLYKLFSRSIFFQTPYPAS
jgi:hypothetical protein